MVTWKAWPFINYVGTIQSANFFFSTLLAFRLMSYFNGVSNTNIFALRETQTLKLIYFCAW